MKLLGWGKVPPQGEESDDADRIKAAAQAAILRARKALHAEVDELEHDLNHEHHHPHGKN